jgi:hypothetical protein
MRVVVIGNSRDLLDRDDGERIDSFDRIVRMNSFKLNGFETQVGSRIDIVCICLSLDLVRAALVHSAHLIARAEVLWTPSWRGQKPNSEFAEAAALIGCPAEDIVFCDDTGHKDAVMRTYALDTEFRSTPEGSSDKDSPFYPTTGFQTLHLVEARFPAAEIFITGFGLNSEFDLRRFDTSGIGIWPGHDIWAERRYLLKGIDQGRWKKL